MRTMLVSVAGSDLSDGDGAGMEVTAGWSFGAGGKVWERTSMDYL